MEEKELNKRLENLEENIGIINVYKDIIRNFDKTTKISIISTTISGFLVCVLSILIVSLMIAMFHNQEEFTKYREESITKYEIIEMLESLKADITHD